MRWFTGWLRRVPTHQIKAVNGSAIVRGDGALVAVLAASGAGRADVASSTRQDRIRSALATLDADVACSIEVGLEPVEVGPWLTAHAAVTAGERDPTLRRLAACHRGFLRAQACDGLVYRQRCLITLAVPGSPARRSGGTVQPSAAVARLDEQVTRLSRVMGAAGIELTRLDTGALAHLVRQRLESARAIRVHSRASQLGQREAMAATAQ